MVPDPPGEIRFHYRHFRTVGDEFLPSRNVKDMGSLVLRSITSYSIPCEKEGLDSLGR